MSTVHTIRQPSVFYARNRDGRRFEKTQRLQALPRAFDARDSIGKTVQGRHLFSSRVRWFWRRWWVCRRSLCFSAIQRLQCREEAGSFAWNYSRIRWGLWSDVIWFQYRIRIFTVEWQSVCPSTKPDWWTCVWLFVMHSICEKLNYHACICY